MLNLTISFVETLLFCTFAKSRLNLEILNLKCKAFNEVKSLNIELWKSEN